MGWIEFAVALLAFLVSHRIPAMAGIREQLNRRLGAGGFVAGYSILSTVLLAWLIVAATRAPYIEIIPPYPMLRWVPLLVMPLVCLLIVSGTQVHNPLSFGGMRQHGFDPSEPGVLRLSRHPLLLALGLWSAAHLLANGGLAHVILFGIFAGFSGLGMALVDRRKKRELGDQWPMLARGTAWFAPAGLRELVRPKQIALAAILYGALLALHETVIGYSPFP